jgi:hypothetical protein
LPRRHAPAILCAERASSIFPNEQDQERYALELVLVYPIMANPPIPAATINNAHATTGFCWEGPVARAIEG